MKARQEVTMKIVQTARRWGPGLVASARDRQRRRLELTFQLLSFQEELDPGSREEKNQEWFPLFWL